MSNPLKKYKSVSCAKKPTLEVLEETIPITAKNIEIIRLRYRSTGYDRCYTTSLQANIIARSG